ncbi:MAG TPA: histidine-type phosphatase [Caulobacteraceae bacterium]|nr:histidine-type phosphatase [Caulobacteraceae bacterium]
MLPAALAATLAAAHAVAAPKLERVVLVQRHGVRSPTSSNAELARLSAQPWPAWPVPPGDLTSHGVKTVALMGRSLRAAYAGAGLIPAGGCPGAGRVVVWADGKDERTRRSGQVLAQALAPGCGVRVGWTDPAAPDPIFRGATEPACRPEPAAAEAALDRAIGPGGLDTDATRAALVRLQAIVAPKGCRGGPGMCFAGADTLATTGAWPKGSGPLFVGASLAEDLLLEYAQGMPRAEVGWGRASEADIAAVMALHQRVTGLIRHNPYVAGRAGAAMARLVLAALAGEPGPHSGPGVKLLALAGHDTNVLLMAGVFGLDWALPDEPDYSSPAETLAFELWRDHGRAFVRPVLFYEPLDQLRTLSPALARRLPLRFPGCASGPLASCPLGKLRARLEAVVPAGCGEAAVGAVGDSAAETAAASPPRS